MALHRRVGDWFSAGAAGGPVKTATAPQSGEVAFTGLEDGARFWIVIDGSGTAATAKSAPAGKRHDSPADLRGQRRPPEPSQDVTTGAADTRSARGLTEAQQAARKRSEASKRAAATRRAKKAEAEKRKEAAAKAAATRRAKAAKGKGGKAARKKG